MYALKCNCVCGYIDMFLVVTVMPGVGMCVNTCIYHVLSQQIDSSKTTVIKATSFNQSHVCIHK